MQRLIAVALFCATMSGAASAQGWTSDMKKDDFGDRDRGFAIALSEGRGFGLRCTKGEEPTLLFATREQWTDGLGAIPASILVKVDDLEAVTLSADLESYDVTNAFRAAQLVRAVSTDQQVMKVVNAIKGAKKRVAVAIEIGDQRFESTRFGVKGSGSSIEKILGMCDK